MDAIAFYLTQYHPIPENDKVYGPNFTEWDNARAAKPLFTNHAQPKLPHPSIGFYNLLDEDFLVFQHELAWQNGVKGFCYYYYNMGGKRLLEKPLDIIAQNKTIKNRFCLCWDHSSWYDNRQVKREIFLEQHYSPANAAAMFADLLPYFENERYIKVRGKPLFCIWAPERHPMIMEYVDIWRNLASKRGLRGLQLAAVQAYQGAPPEMFGMDCAIEYAPGWSPETLASPENAQPRLMDYQATAKSMLARPVPPYTRLRCIFPGWDNTPRRGRHGIVTINLSLDVYAKWLDALAVYTQAFLPKEMQYIFINGWNEWGEGCFLEPDLANGYAYLNATREILSKYS